MELNFQNFVDGFSFVGASNTSYYTSPFCSCKRLRTLDLSGCTGETFSYMNYLVAGCEALTDITLPTSSYAKRLTDSAFRGCKALTRVEIPANFTNLYQNASGTFQENDALVEVDILGSPKILGGKYSSYFYSTFTSTNTTFERLIIRGSSMATISDSSGNVLSGDGYIFGATYSSGSYVANVPANLTIYVPDDLVATYKADANWGNYASIITGISNLTGGS